MRLGPEDTEMALLFDWIRLKPDILPYAWHTGNERKCSIQQGVKLKRLGVKAGVADVTIAIPRGQKHGLFIEMKSGKGRLTPRQQEFLDNMNAQGYLAVCCHGFDAAKSVIETYLKS
jgi:hypothetical protein